MAIGGRLGLSLDIAHLPRSPEVMDACTALFAESNTRFLVEVAPANAAAFEVTLAGAPCARIGRVTEAPTMAITGFNGDNVIGVTVESLVRAWQSTAVI
jgi:phosphoribosylformylglycinamidine synthase